MDFTLSPAQLQLRQAALEFAQRNLSHDLASRDLDDDGHQEWRKDWTAASDFGAFAMLPPSEYGGKGASVVDTVLMLEALGEGCRDNGLTLGINGHIWAVMEPIIEFGTDAQKAHYLPGLSNGTLVGAHGMTEAASGSDAFSLSTQATRVDGGYVLNGEKVYVGLGPVCDLALVFATTDPAVGRWGVTAFLVEAGDRGFERGPSESKLGLRASPMGTLKFTDCFVPDDRMLGGEGAGAGIFSHSMEWERSFIFASHVGAMARQLKECAVFAARRVVFGKPIDQHQSVSNRLADMRMRLETARLMLYKAAWMKDEGLPSDMMAAMTKLHISEAFVASSMDAMRIHGGQGYMEETGVPRDLRDALGGVIYSGTSDIQRQIISALLRGEVQ